VRFCIVGYGAIATFHRDALLEMGDVVIDSVVGRVLQPAQEFAESCNAEFVTCDLAEALARPTVDAVLIASSSQVHYEQTMSALAAGKHVLLEIPMTLRLDEAEELNRAAQAAGATLMVCHTERFYAPNLWLSERIHGGSLRPLHLHRDWHFFRRTNVGWTGRERSWVDDILWHHGGHAVDTAIWLFREEPQTARALYGPRAGPDQVPLDLSAQLGFPGGGLASLVLSYNAMVDAVTTRTVLICEEDTFTFLGGVLTNHSGEVVAEEEQMLAVPRQNREFVDSVAEGRTPRTGIQDLLASWRALDRLERSAADASY
jgi:2-hydroxy-4-carboxymuconate semialdehyde hemiacetal dehydrogenase